MFYFPHVTGWTNIVLLLSCHRVGKQCSTYLLSQGGQVMFFLLLPQDGPAMFFLLLPQDGPAMFYFHPVTGWTQDVLPQSCHRVIKHYSTSIVTQDGLAIFLFYTVTGWANNVLCPSCHWVDPQCSTSLLPQG